MKQKYDLTTLVTLNPMHDQRVTSIELSGHTLIFHYSEMHYYNPCGKEAQSYLDSHKAFHSCDLSFSGIEDADVFAEIRKKDGLNIKATKYYDNDFLEFIRRNKYSLETIAFYYGYKSVIVHSMLVNPEGYYCEECIIKICTSEIIYEWN